VRVLVAEDVRRLADDIAEGLRDQGIAADVAYDGADAAVKLDLNPYDVLVLDRDLPGIHGDTICRTITAAGNPVMILMLTAAGTPADRVTGLALGADDYLPKPFHLRELLARVKSVLRRASSRTQTEKPAGARARARFAGWHLDLATRELVSPGGDEVRLTTGEFDLLAAFVNNANQVLSRDRLLDLARNREAGPFDRTIDVQVGRLRRKLEPDPEKPTIIKTVRGTGYIFTPSVDVV
jgi:two-component system OmpR family response regulator